MDFHCHLDLYPNALEVFREAAARNEFTWLVTTSPKAFVATSRVLGGAANVLVTPGLHPRLLMSVVENSTCCLNRWPW